VDWEHLTRMVLLGSESVEPLAKLLVRVLLGIFFAISGGYKLFVPSRARSMYNTLVEAGVPSPRIMAWFVSAVEFVGGCLLIVGLMSTLASLALLVDMVIAVLTNKLFTMPKKLSLLDWIDDFLYLPEVLYILFFVWLIGSGPGRFSVDYLIAMHLAK